MSWMTVRRTLEWSFLHQKFCGRIQLYYSKIIVIKPLHFAHSDRTISTRIPRWCGSRAASYRKWSNFIQVKALTTSVEQSLNHSMLDSTIDEDGLLFDTEDIVEDKSSDAAGASPLNSITIDPPQKQSLEHAQLLFDLMAPHLTLEEIMQIKDKMQRFTLQVASKQISIHQYVTLTGHLNAILNGDTMVSQSKTSSLTNNKTSSKASPIPTWIHPIMTLFFANTIDETKSNVQWNTLPSSIIEDPTFPTNVNRVDFDKNVQLWVRARQIFTKSHSSKQKESLVSTNKTDKSTLQEKQFLHISKKQELSICDAEHVASLLADKLPTPVHQQIMEMVTRWSMDTIQIVENLSTSSQVNSEMTKVPSSNEKSIQQRRKPEQNKSPLLLTNLRTCAGLHAPLILQDLTEYFYQTTVDKEKSRTLPTTGKKKSKQEPQIQSWKRWNRLRDDIVPILVQAQHSYVELCEDAKKQDEDHSDTDDEFLQALLDQGEEGPTQTQAESLAESVNTKKPVAASAAKEKKESKRFISFNTLLFQDYSVVDNPPNAKEFLSQNTNDATVSSNRASLIPPCENIVFIDNLPIDITKEELQILYSRCGELESIHIFNLKPALDPGEATRLKQKMMLKNSRLSGVKAAQPRIRPRSPVYAMLKFKDMEGYKTATKDALRIFGMIYRNHPMRSIPAHTMTNLYIENMPSGQRSLALEEKLCEVLFPFMRVYLDLGIGPVTVVRNCEIRFPSFHSCYHAYSLLLNSHDDTILSPDRIQWFKTPANAMDYWTRSIMLEH